MKITTEARIEVTTPREIRERVSIELALLASILRSSSKNTANGNSISTSH